MNDHLIQQDRALLAEYLSRGHLWPEERRETQRLADRLGITLTWFQKPIADRDAKPQRVAFEEIIE